MFDLKHTMHRRGFLGNIAAASATLSVASLGMPTSLLAGQGDKSMDAGFEAWLGKIKGKHRQVFDAPGTNGGLPLAWARVFLMTNKQVGVADDDVSAVIVLRHDAIPLAMQDDVWSKYDFGNEFKITDQASKMPAKRNPFFHPKPDELPLPGMAVEDLQASGVLLGVCDMALTFNSMMMGKKMEKDGAEIKKDWVAAIIPGIQIVPSGVLAVNRAQEHGCSYCYAG